MDQALGVVDVAEHARDVGQHDELLGADRRGDRRGGGVGVDVELLAVGAVIAIDGITGTWPAYMRLSIVSRSTRVTSPT